VHEQFADAPRPTSGHEGSIMKQMTSSVTIGAAGFSLFGFYAAFGIDVSEDAVIADVQSQSLWASLATAAAGISVLAQAIDKWL